MISVRLCRVVEAFDLIGTSLSKSIVDTLAADALRSASEIGAGIAEIESERGDGITGRDFDFCELGSVKEGGNEFKFKAIEEFVGFTAVGFLRSDGGLFDDAIGLSLVEFEETEYISEFGEFLNALVEAMKGSIVDLDRSINETARVGNGGGSLKSTGSGLCEISSESLLDFNSSSVDAFSSAGIVNELLGEFP